MSTLDLWAIWWFGRYSKGNRIRLLEKMLGNVKEKGTIKGCVDDYPSQFILSSDPTLSLKSNQDSGKKTIDLISAFLFWLSNSKVLFLCVKPSCKLTSIKTNPALLTPLFNIVKLKNLEHDNLFDECKNCLLLFLCITRHKRSKPSFSKTSLASQLFFIELVFKCSKPFKLYIMWGKWPHEKEKWPKALILGSRLLSAALIIVAVKEK